MLIFLMINYLAALQYTLKCPGCGLEAQISIGDEKERAHLLGAFWAVYLKSRPETQVPQVQISEASSSVLFPICLGCQGQLRVENLHNFTPRHIEEA